MFAAESRRKALVEAMLNFNPDLTIKGASDKTALDFAKGDDDISSLIRERGGLSLSLSLSLSPSLLSLTHAFQSIPGCLPFHLRMCIVPSYVSPAKTSPSFPIMHRVPYQAVSPGVPVH